MVSTHSFIEFGDTGLKVAVRDDIVSAKMQRYIKNGWYEADEVDQINKILDNDEIVVELGSGVGLISTIAYKTGKVKALHCFEADPRLVSLIELTHKANGVENATIYNELACSDDFILNDDQASFYLRSDFWENSLSPNAYPNVEAAITVKAATLGDILKRISPTILIVDIEGAEAGLFTNLRLESVKKIALEVHQSIVGPAAVRRIFEDLQKAGFHYDARYSRGTVPVFSRITDTLSLNNIELDLSRVVSLGDNCEFAFVQQAYGLDKESSLLRWAYVPPEKLLPALTNNFEDIFQFRNLVPYARSMVQDSKYGISFHTKMTSLNNKFDADEDTRRGLHQIELRKHYLLRERLLQMLKEDRVFVYKRSGPVLIEFCTELGQEISRRGNGKLLFVYDEGPGVIGSTRQLNNNVYIAKIDRIAPASKANQPSMEGWLEIIYTLSRLLKN